MKVSDCQFLYALRETSSVQQGFVAPTTCPRPNFTVTIADVALESSPSSFGKIRELRPLQELALEGWDIQDLCKKICCVDTVDPSRVPSPFADLADREDSFMHIIGHHVHPAVTNLFDNLQLGGIAKLTTWLDERQPGAFGTWQCDGIGPQFFAVRRFSGLSPFLIPFTPLYSPNIVNHSNVCPKHGTLLKDLSQNIVQ